MAKPDPNRAAVHAAAQAQKQAQHLADAQARKDAAAQAKAARDTAAAQHKAAQLATAQQKQSVHAAALSARQATAAQKRQASLDAKAARQAARQAANAPVAVPTVDNTLSPQPYAAGGSGAAATGYGSYAYDSSAADNSGSQTTGGDSQAQTDSKAASGLTTKSKVLIGVGGGVLLVGFVLYRRYVARPLRRYRQVKGALQGIIGGYKNFRAELAKG